MKALILSAGQGSRLLPLTAEVPKCLIELSGLSLLEWQLQALVRAGVTDAVVVTGFGAAQVESMLARCAPAGLRLRTLFNPFYKLTDNLATCWLARHELEGDCLILNGDTLFEPDIAARLLAAPPAPIVVTIDRKPQYDSDDMKVQTDGDRLLAIGKTLKDDVVNGESIGFLRFLDKGAKSFVAEIERVMRTPEGVKLWYLSAINGLAKSGYEVAVQSIERLEWGEVDFHPDVARARDLTASWASRWLNPASPIISS